MHTSPTITSPLGTPPATVLRLKQVIAMTGLSGPTIYRLTGTGMFPRPFKLTHTGSTMRSASGWLLSEIQDWICERVSSRDEDSHSA
ncbi:AlpA family phage regulatory protein [Bosea sp. PAMC 26642]|uniref:helix-turn-helix transcriptional regulator n=1 Tax=Bosea sp. (strain PAMC 26642) TaxID=1792307 RepID=UPI0009E9F32F